MTYVFDIEILPNYALVAFKNIDTGCYIMFDTEDKFTRTQKRRMLRIMKNNLIISFNGKKYDMPITAQILFTNHSVKDFYKTSKLIIGERMQFWNVYKKLRIKEPDFNHVDIIEPAPAVGISLKLYGTRLGSRRLQEFPVDFDKDVNAEQIRGLRKYCQNDLIITEELYLAIKPAIELRERMSEEYGFDMRSLSDAQMAEKILVHKVGGDVKPLRLPEGHKIKYTPPSYIKFKTPVLKELFKIMCEHEYNLDKTGKASIPASIRTYDIEIGSTKYQIGIGGLHSKDKTMRVDGGLMNADIASMYPSMIINQGLYPESFGEMFLEIYEDIKATRLQAKKLGKSDPAQKDIADSLKIVLNGSYGKFGSKYSKLYDPSLLLQTTITGQLTLLMLIEELELNGITVVSANTDGVECKAPTPRIKRKIKRIVDAQGVISNLEYEYGEYKTLYARDVNNYVAVYDGYVKAKGVYGNEMPLKKNMETPIIYEAIREMLLNGKPVKETIDECDEFVKFTTARSVKGGAVVLQGEMPELIPAGWEESLKRNKRITKKMEDAKLKLEKNYVQETGLELGKVVRWYYSKNGSPIYTKTSGNKVPKSDGAKYVMDLFDEIPDDLDYEKYYDYADKYLTEIGYFL